MGGDNCGVQGCTLSRKTATNVISFHDILRLEKETWRERLLHLLGRDWRKEKSLGKTPLSKRKHIYICSRHFERSCFTLGMLFTLV